jgi:hypothetical protein
VFIYWLYQTAYVESMGTKVALSKVSVATTVGIHFDDAITAEQLMNQSEIASMFNKMTLTKIQV